MLSFMITSCFICFKNSLKHFRSSVTISRVTRHFKQLLEGAEEKVKSGMKIPTFKIFNLETNRFTEMLKQTRKRRSDVIPNVEPLLLLKSMNDTLDGRDLLTKMKSAKNFFSNYLCQPFIRIDYKL